MSVGASPAAAGPSDPTAKDLRLKPAFGALVELHEDDIGDVAGEQDERLPPLDLAVVEEDDQADQADAIERHVAEQRPPGELEDAATDDGARADDEEDVEDGRPDDRADADVAVRDEDADDAGEQFGRAAAGRHEGGAGDVLRDGEPLGDHLQGGHEELVADDRQRDEHVDDAEDVQHDAAVAQLVLAEHVRRVESGARPLRHRGLVGGRGGGAVGGGQQTAVQGPALRAAAAPCPTYGRRPLRRHPAAHAERREQADVTEDEDADDEQETVAAPTSPDDAPHRWRHRHGRTRADGRSPT